MRLYRGELRATVLGLARVAVLAGLVLGCVLAASTTAFGAVEAPGWAIESLASPTNFSEANNEACVAEGSSEREQCDMYEIVARNAGKRSTDGSNVVLTDTLPAGVSVRRLSLFAGESQENLSADCSTAPLRCSVPAELASEESLKLRIFVTVTSPSVHGDVMNAASVVGGGAPQASTTSTNSIGLSEPGFGIAQVSSYLSDESGRPDTQAGGHPYALTTRIAVNNGFRIGPDGIFAATSVQDLKDVVVDLPLGFAGSAISAPRCPLVQLSSVAGCPSNTIVGHILSVPSGPASVDAPIFNVVPESGQAAEFGFIDNLHSPHVLYAHVVPTPSGYILRVIAPPLAQITLRSVLVSFFGDPAERDAFNGQAIATLTNPAQCSGLPLTTAVHVDSWQEPAPESGDTPELNDPRWKSAATQTPPVTGCNLLQFNPSLSVTPDTSVADSPSGLNVTLDVQQSVDPRTLSSPPLRNAVVTLPAGLSVDPSAAGGLASCSVAQIGWLGRSLSDFTPAPPTCPDASKIGNAEVTTPLLEGTLEGSVYLAAQDENPFHSLLAGYIVVDDPKTGIVVKIPGELATNAQTGQITGSFRENPQLPFSELKLRFFGGPHGDLATPEACGSYTTTSSLEPWSAPDSGPAPAPSSTFGISSGCVSGFSPAFSAGTVSPKAGAYSAFTLSFSRADSEEGLAGLSVTLPPGLLAKIAGVAKCPEAAIAAAATRPGLAEQASPSCPAASQVGSVNTAAGPGPDPTVVAGKAYLTGPYKGAPYGLAVVVPAVAGPFDLGTVVIRQALFIDPTDGHVTAVSDPFPTILQGIPLRLKRVEVTLDRSSFTFNPTSCEPMAISGAFTSIGGARSVKSPGFQATGCRELSFNPSFSASTRGVTSKAKGASLVVKIAQRPGEANIRKVDLQLPIALPSRLTTLQKACSDAQFKLNPAGCPEGSFIGTATAHTPALNVPLSGPAILVSHGGEAFPDVQFVLQGEGVEIVLDGKTNIKKGITYSRFETVPDAPISSFETSLPQGPHSVLAAPGNNLCKIGKTTTTTKQVTRRVHGKRVRVRVKVKKFVAQPLLMPTTLVGQNGIRIVRSTKIAVTGCARPATKNGKGKEHAAKPKR